MSLISSFKGILGETVINVAMWLKLDKEIYHRLNNVTLPLASGGSTQIDHVIVSIYGIFVIETKNYKGWIYGNEQQRQWTQAFASGHKYKFQNPLRQNYLHIKTLADLLDLDMSYFHSMIAFIGECELKTRDELPEHVLTSGMASYIKRKQQTLLTTDDVKAIIEHIENKRFAKSWRTNRAHKAYLKDKHSTSKSKNTNTQKEDPSKVRQSATVIEKAQPSNVINAETKPIVRERLKSREVHQWSGQAEQDDILAMPFTSKNAVFMTPFALLDCQNESANEVMDNTERLAAPHIIPDISAEKIEKPTNSTQAMTCPKCHSAMIKRVAKKGARQGQLFYGCSQYPKCRQVINVKF